MSTPVASRFSSRFTYRSFSQHSSQSITRFFILKKIFLHFMFWFTVRCFYYFFDFHSVFQTFFYHFQEFFLFTWLSSRFIILSPWLFIRVAIFHLLTHFFIVAAAISGPLVQNSLFGLRFDFIQKTRVKFLIDLKDHFSIRVLAFISFKGFVVIMWSKKKW